MFEIAQEYNIFDTITYTSLFGAIHFLPMATEHLVAPLLFHGNIPRVIHSLPPPPPLRLQGSGMPFISRAK